MKLSLRIIYNTFQDLQECVFLIKEVEEQPADSDVSHSVNYSSPSLRDMAYDSREEEFVDAAEAEDLLCKIDGDGVQTDHSEEKSPLLPSLHIYYIIEQCEHSEAVCTYDKYK